MPSQLRIVKPEEPNVAYLQSMVLLFERLLLAQPFISIGSGSKNRTLEYERDERGRGLEWVLTYSLPNGYSRTERFETGFQAIEAALKP